MCAIIGFIRNKPGIDVAKIIDHMAAGNVARGPDAFGFAWVDKLGRIKCYKSAGKMTEHRGLLLAAASEAVAFIGHLRWATHGHPSQNINNHPHPVDGGWFVHNGVVSNYEALVIQKRLFPVSECDTEAVGLLVEAEAGTMTGRFGNAINATEGDLAVMALWTRPTKLLIARRGNPLNGVAVKDALYFATVSDGLPGKPAPIPDNAAYMFDAPGKPVDSIKLRRPNVNHWRRSLFDRREYTGG